MFAVARGAPLTSKPWRLNGGTMEQAVIALIALIAMEIILGIDNIVFIALLTGRLPKEQQALEIGRAHV